MLLLVLKLRRERGPLTLAVGGEVVVAPSKQWHWRICGVASSFVGLRPGEVLEA